MIFGILGAGAVGGYYGSRLFRAGHVVRLVARGAHAEAIARSGLEVRSDLGDVAMPPATLVRALSDESPVDCLLVAVKLKDTVEAARGARSMVGPDTVVMSLQNGVDKDDDLSRVFGPERVVGGITYILATITEPGVVVHNGTVARIVTGERDGKPSARLGAVVAAMRDAGIDVVHSDDIRRDTWKKLIFLSAMAALTTLTGLTIGEILIDARLRRALQTAMEEGAAVAAAEGIQLPDGFVAERMAFIATLPADGRSSMAADLAKGAPLELEWLSGAIVRRAARHAIDVPIHRHAFDTLLPFADGGGDTYRWDGTIPVA
jgi:2-dehydropantoate 2-reductase